MMTQTELEARLLAVEAALQEMQRRLATPAAYSALARRDERVVQR